jgi:hypothetical protein
MASLVSHLVTRVAYGVTQLPRVAWYVGHGLVLRQLSEAARRQEGKKARRRPRTDLPVPERSQIYADMAALFLQDLARSANCGAGRESASSSARRKQFPCRAVAKTL